MRSIDVKDELTMSEVLDPSIGILGAREKIAVETEAPVPPAALTVSKSALAQVVLIVLGVVAALYFARPVLLPIFIACVAGMTLKPLIRWSSNCHIPPAFSAAIGVAVSPPSDLRLCRNVLRRCPKPAAVTRSSTA